MLNSFHIINIIMIEYVKIHIKKDNFIKLPSTGTIILPETAIFTDYNTALDISEFN